MAAMCVQLNTLPRVGGLLDQDSFFVHVLTSYAAALKEREQIEAQQKMRQAQRGR